MHIHSVAILFFVSVYFEEDILKHISKEIGKVFIKLVYKKNNNER